MENCDHNIVISCGYVEDSRPSKLWLNYYGPKGQTPKELATRFLNLLLGYIKAEFQPKACCTAALIQKKENKSKASFCQDCGKSLDEDDVVETHKHYANSLFHELVCGTVDSIAGWGNSYDGFDEYMRNHGWELYGHLLDGRTVLIYAFDRFIEDQNSVCVEFEELEATFRGKNGSN